MSASKRAESLVLVLLVQVLLAFAGCNRPAAVPATPAPQPQSLPTTPVQIGSKLFVLEIAPDDKSRGIGLMYRDSMPADRGMVFAFADEQVLEFYMRNTRIPLDIMYLDRNGKIVSIKQMKPYDLTTVSSESPAMYAVELNQGVAQTTGLKVGDTVRIPPEVRAKDQ